MQVEITGKGVEITDRRRVIIDQKLAQPLDQYLKSYPEAIKKATVFVTRGSRWGFKISFSMRLPGKRHIFSEAKAKEFTKAVTETREQAERQIKEYRGKS